jgi:uroporphyrinogen decarboxylase
MTSRERVQTALARRAPDRVPIDVWGSASRLCNLLYFDVANDQKWPDLGPFVSASRSGDYVDARVADLVGADIRHLVFGKPKYFAPRADPDGVEFNEWGVGFTKVAGEPAIARVPFPEPDAAALARHAWPNPRDPGRLAGVAEQARRWHEQSEFYVATSSLVSGLMLDIGPYLRGFEEFFLDLYLNPEFAHELIEKITDVLIEMHRYALAPVAPYVGWVEFSSDHGMQDRLLVSPETYREFFKKPYARLFAEVRKVAPHAKIWMHSCGAVRDLIPDFIEMGVDVLNSLQPRAAGMDHAALKRDFGRDIVFHGGLDMQGALSGTPEQAADEARRCLDALAAGGGYVFAPSNHFMQDIPLANFYAVYEVARSYR